MTSAWRRLLLPFVPLYAGVIGIKRWLRSCGLLRQRRLTHPVVSVGSLSAGGAGKTPVVLMLAEMLLKRGVKVRILSRGYGRAGTVMERVNPSGDAARFGDEPLLLARRLPAAAVFVGSDRYLAGRLAESEDTEETRAIYILDDGFQHERLAREVDLLLVTNQDLADTLLPAGNLREPLKRIEAATFLVVREDESQIVPALRKRGLTLPPVLVVRRRVSLPVTLPATTRPLIFSGLARPASFLAMLRDAGVNAEVTRTFPDHHRYTTEDMDSLVIAARQADADSFVTTEKDAVKLTPAMLERLQEIGPMCVAELSVELIDGASVIDTLLTRLLIPAPALHEKITS